MTGVRFWPNNEARCWLSETRQKNNNGVVSWAATERFQVVIFKTANQLDLVSLRDHKSMLLWIKDLDVRKKKKTSYGLEVPQQYARRRIIYWFHIIVTPKDTLNQSIWVLKADNGKKENSVFPLVNSKALTQGIEKTIFVVRSDSPLNIQSIEIWSSWNIFKKLIWRFYAGVHSCRQESIWSSGRYIFPFLSNFFMEVSNLRYDPAGQAYTGKNLIL